MAKNAPPSPAIPAESMNTRIVMRRTGTPALAMDAEDDTADRRASLKHRAQSIAAIRPLGLLGQAGNGVVGVSAAGPVIAMHPDAEVKFQTTRHSLLADVLQHLEIVVTF